MISRQTMLDTIAKHDPVPCGGCTACCRGNQAITLHPEFGDDPERYEHWLELVNGSPMLTIPRKPDGACHYLRRGGCAIYADRPALCRAFDCRRQFLAHTKAERRDLVRAGLFSREIVEAGKKRAGTVKPMEGEDALRASLRHVNNRRVATPTPAAE